MVAVKNTFTVGKKVYCQCYDNFTVVIWNSYPLLYADLVLFESIQELNTRSVL
jgi:hypothetical protein